MKLLKIRVQNYKKIKDTDWVSCRDLTVFVGKNEAGKSALFRGLSKLNPSDDQKYDPLKEFPRRRYTDEFKSQDWPVASGLFKLSPEEQQALGAICPALKDVTTIECTRRYSWALDIVFKPGPTLPTPQVTTLIEAIEKAKTAVQDLTAPEGKGPALGTLKTNLGNALNSAQQSLAARPKRDIPSKAEAEAAVTAVTNCSTNGNISLNWRLVTAPRYVADHLILHELLHTRIMNHTHRFWVHLKAICPDHKNAIAWLQSNRAP